MLRRKLSRSASTNLWRFLTGTGGHQPLKICWGISVHSIWLLLCESSWVLFPHPLATISETSPHSTFNTSRTARFRLERRTRSISISPIGPTIHRTLPSAIRSVTAARLTDHMTRHSFGTSVFELRRQLCHVFVPLVWRLWSPAGVGPFTYCRWSHT